MLELLRLLADSEALEPLLELLLSTSTHSVGCRLFSSSQNAAHTVPVPADLSVYART